MRLPGWIDAARELWLDVVSLVWPSDCVACGRFDRDLCTPCRRAIMDGELLVASSSGLGVPCFVTGPYDGPVRAALIAYKHRGAFGFRRVLGARLGPALRAACAEATTEPVVVTAPSRAARVRERGYRHVDEVVKIALRREGLPLRVSNVLRSLPGRTGQVGRRSADRERNARRIAVRRGRRLRGREVVLVDDIVTTGATIRSAVRVLEAAGASVVAVAALCTVERVDARPPPATSKLRESE